MTHIAMVRILAANPAIDMPAIIEFNNTENLTACKQLSQFSLYTKFENSFQHKDKEATRYIIINTFPYNSFVFHY